MSRTAATAYNEHAAAAIELAEAILAKLKAEQAATTTPDWGHVGSMAKTREDLANLAEWFRV
jgi:hypothetical protein